MQATTPTLPGLMQHLKESTAELHAFAESRLLQRRLLQGAIEPMAYRRYLTQLHAIHRALEHALTPWRAHSQQLECVFSGVRQHSINIEQDIASLDAWIGGSERSAGAPALTDGCNAMLDFIHAHAEHDLFALLGSFYVLEGSMNGNRYLARALAKHWPAEGQQCLRYLDPYGDVQRATWQSFREAMDALDADAASIDRAVDGAQRTFKAVATISDEVLAEAGDAVHQAARR